MLTTIEHRPDGDKENVAASETLPAVIEQRGISVSMLPSEMMKPMLAEYVDRRKTFRDWLLSQLRSGVHFGIPPGCEPKTNRDGLPVDDSGRVIEPDRWQFKPSLYKAGADFICDLLQMDPRFSPDVEAWKMLGGKEGTVVMKCVLISREQNPFFRRAAGEVLGEGRGAGVSGVKRRDGNGAIKIAQKSSKIDAVINALGLSDLFTQDLEDQTIPSPKPSPDQNAPRVAPRDQRDKIPSMATKLNALAARWKARFNEPNTDGFPDWAARILRTDADMSKLASWSVDAIEAVSQEID